MPLKSPQVLLVEGPDDYHFLGHFCVQRGLPLGWKNTQNRACWPFEIQKCGGYPGILTVLEQQLSDIEYRQIGVVLDADLELGSRWHAIRERLLRLGYALPQMPEASGTIAPHPDEYATVGLWLMPDNRAAGMLEHFAEFLVPNGDTNPSWARAKSVVAGLSEQERGFTVNQHQKAVVHTWLAWQDEPGTPLGQAVTKRYLDPTVPQADQLADWLIRLFELDLPASGQLVG